MVLQNYGFNISSDEECIKISDDLNNSKSGNYSDNMLAMSPYAGDYPPQTNYINYTDLDANYAAPGKREKFLLLFFPVSGHVLFFFALKVHLLPFFPITHSRCVMSM